MNTTYRPIASPFRTRQPQPVTKSPMYSEIEKNIGTFNLTVTVEEDTDTLSLFKHIPGFIAFVCTVSRGTEVLGIGRGSAVLNRLNKFIERGIRYAYCASVIDAVVRSTKTLDALYIQSADKRSPVGGTESSVFVDEPATDAQKSYLLKLITSNIKDKNERTRLESEVGNFTKDEASAKIQSYVKK